MNQRQFEISLNFKLKQIDAEDVPVVRVEKCVHDSMRDMFDQLTNRQNILGLVNFLQPFSIKKFI